MCFLFEVGRVCGECASDVTVPIDPRIFDGSALFFHADATGLRLQFIGFARGRLAQQALLVDHRGTFAVLGAAGQ